MLQSVLSIEQEVAADSDCGKKSPGLVLRVARSASLAMLRELLD